MTTTNTPFHTLEDELNSEILERRQEIHTTVLALLSRKHHFQVGPPGTAKSLTIDRLQKRIDGLGDNGYFRWLLTTYTTPEELFGGPDFQRLREHGEYKRITEKKMPVSYITFADEIFKANSSILNTLLTIMNERQFYNMDDDPSVPLISLFGASNEVPDGEALWAMWDRLHFRHEIRPLQESSSLMQMLSVPLVSQPDPVIHLDDLFSAHRGVDAVEIHGDVYEAIVDLRNDLRKDGVEPTERRWNDSLDIIRAEAWMNGREVADIEDMRPLMHVLWGSLDDQKTVKKTVLELANPIDREASDVIDRLYGLASDITELINDSESPKALAAGGVEVHRKLEKADSILTKLREKEVESGKKSVFLGEAEEKLENLLHRLAKDVFQLGDDDDGFDLSSV